jgi:hypothetical protein
MDAFTAGSLLIASKFGVAVVMIAIFSLLPRERCTLDWALAAALVACGAMVSISNAGAPRYAVLIAGNGAIVLGMVMQWRGVRSFYRKADGYLGWAVFLLFIGAYVWLLESNSSVGDRAVVLSSAILAMLMLSAWEFAAGYLQRRSLGGGLALGSAVFLVLCFLVNVGLSSSGWVEFSHAPNSLLAITLIYLLPFGGSLLTTVGIVLLLYERHVVEKKLPLMADRPAPAKH